MNLFTEYIFLRDVSAEDEARPAHSMKGRKEVLQCAAVRALPRTGRDPAHGEAAPRPEPGNRGLAATCPAVCVKTYFRKCTRLRGQLAHSVAYSTCQPE